METKPASKRQLAYIRRLQTVVGETEPEITEEMSVSEASAVISELVSKARQNGVVLQRQIKEPRLGMAIKECFLCRYRHKKHNADFRIMPTLFI